MTNKDHFYISTLTTRQSCVGLLIFGRGMLSAMLVFKWILSYVSFSNASEPVPKVDSILMCEIVWSLTIECALQLAQAPFDLAPYSTYLPI